MSQQLWETELEKSQTRLANQEQEKARVRREKEQTEAKQAADAKKVAKELKEFLASELGKRALEFLKHHPNKQVLIGRYVATEGGRFERKIIIDSHGLGKEGFNLSAGCGIGGGDRSSLEIPQFALEAVKCGLGPGKIVQKIHSELNRIAS